MLRITNYSNAVLHNIDFTLNEGENLVILGANGVGKSTLAKVLCALEPSSCVTLFDKNLAQLSAKERAHYINYLPAKLDIFDEYISVYEYLELSRLFCEVPTTEVLEQLHISHLANQPCKRLSSGEEQLVMLASAMLHNAHITIFDEPTANLDPIKTQQVFRFLQSDLLTHKIIITHDLNIAHKLGYTVLYLQDGKMGFFGANEDFFTPHTLHNIFGESVQKIDDYFMVKL